MTFNSTAFKKRTACILTCLICIMTLMPDFAYQKAYAQADNSMQNITGSTADGASFNYDHTVTEINVVTDFNADNSGQSYTSASIQNALNYAKDNSSDDNMIKVIFPKGTYQLDTRLQVSSNTWIFCEDGAVIKRNYNTGGLLYSINTGNYGYDQFKNIIVEGGTWDGCIETQKGEFSNVRFAHGNNLLFKNLTIKGGYSGHHLELGGIKNITIDNCSFTGYEGEKQKECIQLDVMNSKNLFIGYDPFDDVACENVVISNNSFTNCCRALGSHSAVIGVYYRNILIENNYCNNLSSTAMIMFNYKDCTIRNNTMNNCALGIEMRTANASSPQANLHAPVSMPLSQAESNIDGYANNIICNNNINISSNSDRPAILIAGAKVTTATLIPNRTYEISGVQVSDNTVTTPSKGIAAEYLNDSIISANNVTQTYKGNFTDRDTISAINCSNDTITENSINGAIRNGLYVSASGNMTISSNTIQNCRSSGLSLNSSSGIDASLNNISGSGCYGIYVAKTTANIDSNDVRSGNKGSIMQNSNVNMTNNSFSYTNAAIDYYASSGNVTGNNIYNSGANGIICRNTCYNMNIANNNIAFTKGIGITVSGSTKSNISVSDNKFINLNDTAIALTDNSRAIVYNNNFSSVKNKLSASSNSIVYAEKINNPTVTGTSPTSIAMTFDSVSKDTYVEIYRKQSGGAYKKIATTSQSGFSDNGLNSSNTYYYKLRNVNKTMNTTIYGSFTPEIKASTSAGISVSSAVKLVNTTNIWTGKAVTPSLAVIVRGRQLTAGKDYTATFSNNINVGTGKVTIKGIGNYTGTTTTLFKIVPKKQTVSVSSVSKNSATVNCIKHKAAGSYQIQISKTSSFSSIVKNLTTKNNTALATAVKSLNGKTTYYVRSRDVTKVGGTTYYGAWSNSVKFTTK